MDKLKFEKLNIKADYEFKKGNYDEVLELQLQMNNLIKDKN